MAAVAQSQWDVIVVGAGAAGLFCAGVLGQRSLRVLVVDHARRIGEKIRISGGGRCNFTNRDTTPASFLSLDPAFPVSALHGFGSVDFIRLVRTHGIGFHEKHRGQLFADEGSGRIIDMLLAECATGKVSIRHPVQVTRLHRDAGRWCIDTDHGAFQAPSVVVATGGLPVPAIGASGWALDLARSLDMDVVAPRPGLVPLAFTSEETRFLGDLAGIALPVVIRAGVRGERYGACALDEDLLMTHKGLSGPAVLQASSYWHEGEAISIDWTCGAELARLLDERRLAGRTAESALAEIMPARLAAALVEAGGMAQRRWAEVPGRQRKAFQAWLQQWTVRPAGTLGWKKAEVMVGGVATAELEPRTMQSHRQPGLYFIGECVDVTGQLGGHNFQWAWASAHQCAMAIASGKTAS